MFRKKNNFYNGDNIHNCLQADYLERIKIDFIYI